MDEKFHITCLMIKDGKILMLQKQKGRHLGAWVFPGGKIKNDETALDTVKREIKHDTGLSLKHVELRGIASFMVQEQEEILFKTNLFVFYSDDFEGELIKSEKGKLEWISLEDIWNREVGRNDKLFIPPMLEKQSVTFAKFYVNKKKELINYQID